MGASTWIDDPNGVEVFVDQEETEKEFLNRIFLRGQKLECRGKTKRARYKSSLDQTHFLDRQNSNPDRGDGGNYLMVSRPVWPRSAPSIPTSFYKSGRANVHILPKVEKNVALFSVLHFRWLTCHWQIWWVEHRWITSPWTISTIPIHMDAPNSAITQ